MDLSKLQDKNYKIDLSDTYNIKSIIFRFILGIFMGASDAVPGYSGGTTLSITNVYDKMIITAKNVLKPDPGVSRLKCLLWMIPFALGWMVTIIGSSVLLKEMLYTWNMEAEVLIFFATLCLFNVPTFLEVNRLNKGRKLIKKKSLWIFFTLGLVLIVGVSVGIFFKGKIEFGTADIVPEWNWSKHAYLLILGGVVGGAIMLIPGGSGSMFIFIIGMYDIVHATILAHPTQHIWQMLIFWVSVFIGMSLSVFASTYLLRHYKDQFSMFSFGMLVASIGAILFIVDEDAYVHLNNYKHIIGAAVASILSFGIAALVFYKARKANEEHIIEKNEAEIIKEDNLRSIPAK